MFCLDYLYHKHHLGFSQSPETLDLCYAWKFCPQTLTKFWIISAPENLCFCLSPLYNINIIIKELYSISSRIPSQPSIVIVIFQLRRDLAVILCGGVQHFHIPIIQVLPVQHLLSRQVIKYNQSNFTSFRAVH